MKCLICRQSETNEGMTTTTLERGGMILVTKGVPAHVCQNCGEAYVDEDVTDHLLKTAERMADAGTLVNVRQYIPA